MKAAVLASITRRFDRRHVIRAVAVLAGLAVAWTLVVGWALPRWLKPRIEAAATETLGVPLAIERLEIEPWALRAHVVGLRLGPTDAPWLRVAEFVADASTESLWRLAPVLERVDVIEPQLELERLQDGLFNVSPLLDALARRPPSPPDSKPARFALHNLRLTEGRVHVVDRVAGTEHRLDGLHIGVPFISNLPSKIAVDVEPRLDAVLDGSRLEAQGRTLPFDDGLRSSIDLHWSEIDLRAWAEALASQFPHEAGELPAVVSDGRLDVALRIDFERRAEPQPPSLRITGGASLARLVARLVRPELGVAVESLVLEGLDLRPLDAQLRVGKLALKAPRLDGDLARLLAAPPRPQAQTAAPNAAVSVSASNATPSAPTWSVGSIELTDGSVRLAHAAWPQPRVLTIESLRLDGLASAPDAAPATLALSANDDRGARLKIDGRIEPAAQRVAAHAELDGLQAAGWIAPWREQLPLRIDDGRFGARAELDASPETWVVRDARVTAEGFDLRALNVPAGDKRAGDDRLKLSRLEMGGLKLEGGAGRAIDAQIAALRLDGLDLVATRGPQGDWGWLPRPSAPSPAPAAAASSAAPAPTWRLDELVCRACSIALSDRSVQPAALLALARIDAKLGRLSSDLARPVLFDLTAQAGRTGRGGRLALRGEATPQPLSLSSRIDIAGLDLAGLQPYLAPHLNLVLMSAKAGAQGDLRVEGRADQPLASVRWKGAAALTELRALDKLNDAELLRFKRLALDGSDVLWRADTSPTAPAPLQADLGRVALEDFFGRVIINADGRINLRDVLKHGEADRSLTTPSGAPSAAAPPEPASAPSPPVAAASTPAAAAATPAAQLRWQGIRVSGGAIDFTDNFIRPNYSARLTDVAGEVAALAWSDPQPAAIKLSGRVDGAAPLEIAGSVHPLGARLATDITASARGIDITRLTAYSARYAGYGIEKGTLSMTVRYRIADGRLEAENRLVLDQLTFGEHVDSPNAMKLPVQLAVALLKDRNGVIDLNLPIRGSLDDPQFSIGGIIVQVIVNLIGKAVTAPFALLASAFGGGGDELGHVDFAPGSSELDDAGTKRLDALSKALRDRPALKLEATGHADAAADEAALQRQHVERLMRAAKAKATGELPDSVTIGADERARWLEAAYRAADLKTKPRNVVGLAKSLPPAEMEALLLASATVDAAALRALADRRGDAVKSELVKTVPPERVLLTASKLGRDGLSGDGPASRVEFALR